MKLSFKFKPKLNDEQLKIIEELSFHTTKLYNVVNYDLRENGFKTYVDIENTFKSNWHCNFLHSHTRQQAFKVLEQNGKKLKSVNSYTNRRIAKLQSIEMKKHGSDKFKNTKEINRLRRYRSNYINDYLHKVSKNIIDKAIEHGVRKIVIGKLKGIKKDMNYNKGFVQVPILRLAELIEYKAKLNGMEVKYKEESYTSGCSAFDLESITKKNYDKTRRVVRGLFKSSYGLVNSDVNGSLNILRKEEKCIPKLVKTMRDKGKCSRPLRIRVAC